jgi:hypothetical protein
VTETHTQNLPPEDVIRGTLFALIAVPLGIAVWLLIWGIGFIASIVAFGVAAAAVFLYRFGSRGRVGLVGAVIVTVITLGTMALAFFAGIAWDVAVLMTQVSELTFFEALGSSRFGLAFAAYVDAAGGDLIVSGLAALAFGLIGSFGTLRGVFASAKTTASQPLDTPPGFGPIGPTTPAATVEPQPETEPDSTR